jgi:hypothetical protein
MDPLIYYAEQSRVTDPGKHVGLLDGLPRDIRGLCWVVQGLVIHYREGDRFGYAIPEERLSEVDTRYADRMLTRIREMDDSPLVEERPPEKRLVGCCRDFTVLFLTLARHVGMPARARVGFASYFDPHFNHDHEVADVWDAEEQRWRLVDPQMSERHIGWNGIRFDVTDVPRDRFLVGGLAWQTCREGREDPGKFGVDPDGDLKGWWFIRHKLVQDLAALNKSEVILWDVWGLMEGEPPGKDLDMLDRVATLTQAGNEAFDELQRLYEKEPNLRVPITVKSYSPVAPPRAVRVEVRPF